LVERDFARTAVLAAATEHAKQQRLLAFLQRVQRDGERTFNGKESASFGPLTSAQWNVLFYKHLDHHLMQFGV